MFIKVTLEVNGKEVYLNANKITEIYPATRDGNGSVIYLQCVVDNEQVETKVKESSNQIIKMINET